MNMSIKVRDASDICSEPLGTSILMPSNTMTTVRVALTQHEPCWFDLQGTVDKTVKLIKEAATNGARLICFPECWVPGYPVWVW